MSSGSGKVTASGITDSGISNGLISIQSISTGRRKFWRMSTVDTIHVTDISI